jgi:hypothetical protein
MILSAHGKEGSIRSLPPPNGFLKGDTYGKKENTTPGK